MIIGAVVTVAAVAGVAIAGGKGTLFKGCIPFCLAPVVAPALPEVSGIVSNAFPAIDVGGTYEATKYDPIQPPPPLPTVSTLSDSGSLRIANPAVGQKTEMNFTFELPKLEQDSKVKVIFPSGFNMIRLDPVTHAIVSSGDIKDCYLDGTYQTLNLNDRTVTNQISHNLISNAQFATPLQASFGVSTEVTIPIHFDIPNWPIDRQRIDNVKMNCNFVNIFNPNATGKTGDIWVKVYGHNNYSDPYLVNPEDPLLGWFNLGGVYINQPWTPDPPAPTPPPIVYEKGANTTVDAGALQMAPSANEYTTLAPVDSSAYTNAASDTAAQSFAQPIVKPGCGYGTLTDTSLNLGSYVADTLTNASIKFTTTCNEFPEKGEILINFGAHFDTSAINSVSCNLNGGLEVHADQTVVKIKRTGGGTTDISAPIECQFGPVKMPSAAVRVIPSGVDTHAEDESVIIDHGEFPGFDIVAKPMVKTIRNLPMVKRRR